MPKPPRRRLKVFTARLGFHETAVAAPSRAAALRAWGVRQDLFAEGLARETDDPAAVEPALAHPGLVLRRPAGSAGTFTEVAGLPPAPQAPPPAPRKSKADEAATLPLPDRKPVDRAEARLARLESDRDKETVRFDARRRALAAAEDAAAAAYDAARAQAQAELEAARSAYRAAGGKD